MKHREVEARVAGVIKSCRREGIEICPETVARMMVEEDGNSGEGSRRAARDAYAEYLKAAIWILVLLDEGQMDEHEVSELWPEAA
jgi:hypothetical protein